jgi:hypothetical protein
MKNSSRQLVFTFLMIVLPLFSKAQSTYTFDSLNINVLNGQDNWIDQSGQGVATIYLDTTIVNGTQIASPVLSLFYLPAFVTRVNDSVFSFPNYSGNETNAIMQFDTRGSYVAHFALGYDLNNDGRLDTAAGEVGPSFGIWNQHFAIQTANLDTLLNAPFGMGNSVFDWYRIQMRIDFTANGGLGMGSLYYLNLSDGDTAYISIPGLQNINLQLNNMNVAATPQNWNAMFLILTSNGGIQTAVDNLIVSTNSLVGIQENNSEKFSSYLVQNAPNPFNSFTTIKYFITEPSMVNIHVFDSGGRKVYTIVNENAEQGHHEVNIDGSKLSNGIYYYLIETEYFIESRKMIRMK